MRSIAERTRSRAVRLTPGVSLSTRDTVDLETPTGAVPAPPAGYSLVFGDDFNGAAGARINEAKAARQQRDPPARARLHRIRTPYRL